ncbi:DUF6890 family protein [Ferrimonas senticii]|nr:hypothetical protein [Ferrimonas senticii]
MALRRHYLPAEDDSEDSLTMALWLDRRYWQLSSNATAAGIGKAFKG